MQMVHVNNKKMAQSILWSCHFSQFFPLSQVGWVRVLSGMVVPVMVWILFIKLDAKNLFVAGEVVCAGQHG